MAFLFCVRRASLLIAAIGLVAQVGCGGGSVDTPGTAPPAPGSGNTTPTVAITAPVSNGVFVAPAASVDLEGTASDNVASCLSATDRLPTQRTPGRSVTPTGSSAGMDASHA